MHWIPSEQFIKDLKQLDQNAKKAIEKSLRLMRHDLRHPSLRVKKMRGVTGIFEASATMDIRITFQFVDQGTILLRACGHHEDVLKYRR